MPIMAPQKNSYKLLTVISPYRGAFEIHCGG